MAATIKMTIRFNTVADDFATAMFALGRERMNGAFERVEDVRAASDSHFHGFVVVVSANFATWHRCPFPHLMRHGQKCPRHNFIPVLHFAGFLPWWGTTS